MRYVKALLLLIVSSVAVGAGYLVVFRTQPEPAKPVENHVQIPKKQVSYWPRMQMDVSGLNTLSQFFQPWRDPTSLEQIREKFLNLAPRNIAIIDKNLASQSASGTDPLQAMITKAQLLMSEGQANEAYEVLERAREYVKSSPRLENQALYSIIFFQGIAGLRRGETENCINCRGEGACVFPILPTAVHVKPAGSQLAIKHFTEYLEMFPSDLCVRWLLNVAYMTLGQYPVQVPPQYLLKFDDFGSELDIGRFKDIAHLVGVNRLNQAGGAVMDDFDNDGRFDLMITTWDATEHMMYYRNKGDGTFEDRTEVAGLSKQYGGLNLVQADYNNDGFLDVFVIRGAWINIPMRPSLLRNNGDGTFTDVTKEAGLMDPMNSISATWADFDNDGFLDLFICSENGPNRLYRNRGDGTFEEVAAKAGVQGKGGICKGAAWLDYDNDGYPDLFLNYLDSTPQLFHNNRDGTFTDVTFYMGITGPMTGFSCWAFDYDNDGWLDIFTTCYQKTVDSVVGGMLGQPAPKDTDVTRLYRNIGGKKFQDVSKETGVNGVFATMGSNFADFTNDGYLDFYLATGDPQYSMLVPNRMFKNVGGKRFAEITTTSRTGHLQKGHGVACGDWDRDGNVDMFVETGGAVNGDKYHNVLFQNPGHANNWLEIKLVGKKTNRSAIGARIKVVTAGSNPLTVHRHVSSGSSFGGNPLQQHIGLGKADSVATIEIQWPTSGTTQVFHDVKATQAIEITEFAKEYRKLDWTPIPAPKE
jgi:hypothetical protein